MRTVWLLAVLIAVTACGGGAGVMSADELTRERQANMDRVSAVAAHVVDHVYGGGEGIDICIDSDRTTGRPEFLVNGTPTDDAEEYVKGELDRRMKADGWVLRDRSAEGQLVYIWDRDDTSLSVDVDRVGGEKPAVSVSGVGPCGKLGKLRYGDIGPDDPSYLEPSPPIPQR